MGTGAPDDKQERKKPRRRTTHYSRRLAMRVCEHIAGGDSLPRALDKEPLAPRMQTWYRWMVENPELKLMYDQARLMQADLQADRTLDMVEDILDNPKDAPAYRLIADIRKWTAEIRDPKRFGQKIQHEMKTLPKDPKQLREEIDLLEQELGVRQITGENTVIVVQPEEGNGNAD